VSDDAELKQQLRRHFSATAPRPTGGGIQLEALSHRVDWTTQDGRGGWLPGRWTVPGIGRIAQAGAAALVVLLTVGLAVHVGASLLPRETPLLPDPFGLARNGAVVFALDGDLWSTDVQGDAARAIVTGPGTDQQPVFSRDGTRLAFLRAAPDGGYDLMTTLADGSGLRRIAVSGVSGFDWSPTGKELAVIHYDPVDRSRLSIVDVDSGRVVRDLDPGGLWPAGWVAWRPPHGSELVFDVHPSPGSPVERALYSIRSDGSGLRQVAPFAVDHGMTWSYDGPQLTPDGKAVIYSAFVGTFIDSVAGVADAHVWRRDLDTGRQDAAPIRDATSAHLSPDGMSILYLPPNDGQLLLGPVDGSSPDVPVGKAIDLSNAALVLDLSPDGRLAVVTLRPDGAAATTEIMDISSGKELATITADAPTWQRLAP
jgi:dipeptidyl aminopeptidase/acylaminoacyl peptidase